MAIEVIKHPLVQASLGILRDKTTTLEDFRENSDRIAEFLLIEASRDLKMKVKEIETPNTITRISVIDDYIIGVPVLRAGMAFIGPLMKLYPNATIGVYGAKRDETTAIASCYYPLNLPGRIDPRCLVLLLDPMLATGGSAKITLDAIKEKGGTRIRFVNVIAAPEGIELLKLHHPDVDIVTAAIDPKLNAKKYIVPGLGDYGDLYFGTTTTT